MQIIKGLIATTFLILANNSFAEYFCISDQGKPNHCDKGDIILIKPTLMPRACDFDAEILRMPKNEKTAEYLCRYTGTIIAIKELKSRRQAQQMKKLQPPPTPTPKKNNKMFDSMPFFK